MFYRVVFRSEKMRSGDPRQSEAGLTTACIGLPATKPLMYITVGRG